MIMAVDRCSRFFGLDPVGNAACAGTSVLHHSQR
jgi:hypothetical protein